MTTCLSYRGGAGAAPPLALTASGTATAAIGSASAGPGDCGVHRHPSLGPTGEHGFGEILNPTEDGIYVGSADDASGSGVENTWDEIDSIAHSVSNMRDEVTGLSAANGTSRPTVWRCTSLIGVLAGKDES